MEIKIHRIYEAPFPQGYHVLVDRLWPRGISKTAANLDEWCKELAPSTELRKWFAHQEEKWPEFCEKYLKELAGHRDIASTLLFHVYGKAKMLVLLYGAKNKTYNHAHVLKEFLEALLEEENELRDAASPPCFLNEFKDK